PSHGHAERAAVRNGGADHRGADEARDRRERGEGKHVAGEDARRRSRIRGDRGPLGLGREHDVLRPLDEIHGMPPWRSNFWRTEVYNGLRPPRDNDAMTTPRNLVEIRDLAFSYGNRPLLRRIDLDIARGQVVAILGTSGSGKTTLLQLIGGLLRPQRGTVKVFDVDVHALSAPELYALRRKMG